MTHELDNADYRTGSLPRAARLEGVYCPAGCGPLDANVDQLKRGVIGEPVAVVLPVSRPPSSLSSRPVRRARPVSAGPAVINTQG
jgi:hypothetical protein